MLEKIVQAISQVVAEAKDLGFNVTASHQRGSVSFKDMELVNCHSCEKSPLKAPRNLSVARKTKNFTNTEAILGC